MVCINKMLQTLFWLIIFIQFIGSFIFLLSTHRLNMRILQLNELKAQNSGEPNRYQNNSEQFEA